MNAEYIEFFFNSDFLSVVVFGFSAFIIAWFLGYSIRLVIGLMNNIKKVL